MDLKCLKVHNFKWIFHLNIFKWLHYGISIGSLMFETIWGFDLHLTEGSVEPIVLELSNLKFHVKGKSDPI